MHRREFLQAMSGAALCAIAPGAFAQAGPTRPLPLGFDAYSIRDLRWKAPRLIDYAAELKLDTVMIANGSFESLEEPYLKKLKAQADRLGVRVAPAFGCFCPKSVGYNPRQGEPVQYLSQGIRVAKALGASYVRSPMGSAKDRDAGTPMDGLIEAAIPILRAVRAQAVESGVKIAIENHGDVQSRQLKALIELAGPDAVGCCFDSGNPLMLAEDPLRALEILAPHVVATHFRDAVVCDHPRGAQVRWVPLGAGTLDFKVFTRRLGELCPAMPFQLEIVTPSALSIIPIFEDEFWKGLPLMPASDLAHFVALAKAGTPFKDKLASLPEIQPDASKTILALQQQKDLERSLDYAKRELGLGIHAHA